MIQHWQMIFPKIILIVFNYLILLLYHLLKFQKNLAYFYFSNAKIQIITAINCYLINDVFQILLKFSYFLIHRYWKFLKYIIKLKNKWNHSNFEHNFQLYTIKTLKIYSLLLICAYFIVFIKQNMSALYLKYWKNFEANISSKMVCYIHLL